MTLSVASRNAALDAVLALRNAGSLEIRSGAAGAVDSAPIGTVMAIFTLPATAFTSASNGAASMSVPEIVSTTIAANVAGDDHAVVKNSGGTVVSTIPTSALTLSSAVWGVGEEIKLTGWSPTMSA